MSMRRRSSRADSPPPHCQCRRYGVRAAVSVVADARVVEAVAAQEIGGQIALLHPGPVIEAHAEGVPPFTVESESANSHIGMSLVVGLFPGLPAAPLRLLKRNIRIAARIIRQSGEYARESQGSDIGRVCRAVPLDHRRAQISEAEVVHESMRQRNGVRDLPARRVLREDVQARGNRRRARRVQPIVGLGVTEEDRTELADVLIQAIGLLIGVIRQCRGSDESCQGSRRRNSSGRETASPSRSPAAKTASTEQHCRETVRPSADRPA